MIFESDIQILRCYSIIIIILFHLNYLKSGYLGVDTFIVISSYLNTNCTKEKNFSDRFLYFLRRINRIIPSSYLVLVFLLFYNNRKTKYDYEYLEEYKNAIIFISNIYYYKRSNDYFNRNSNSPYIHFWYLSLQVQIYILFVIPFMLYHSLCKLFLLLVSISFYYFSYKSNRNYNYYILLPRIWEVVIASTKVLEKKYKMKNISFILMLLYCLLLEGMRVYDQCIYGILTVIFLESNDNFLIKSPIGSILCHIGNISYILYLIHYPLMKLSSEYFLIKLIVVSEIVNYFLDKPIINYTKKSIVKIISNIIFFYSIGIVFYCIYKNKQDKLKGGFVNVLGMTNILYCCDNNNHKRNILIYGDSHAFQLIPLVYNITKGKYVIHFKFHYTKDIFNKYYSLTNKYSIIISKNLLYLPLFSLYINRTSFYYYNYLSYLSNHTDGLIFFVPTPYVIRHTKRHITNYTIYKNIMRVDYLFNFSYLKYINKLLVVNLNKFICNHLICFKYFKNDYIFIDGSHLSQKFLFNSLFNSKVMSNLLNKEKRSTNNNIRCNFYVDKYSGIPDKWNLHQRKICNW